MNHFFNSFTAYAVELVNPNSLNPALPVSTSPNAMEQFFGDLFPMLVKIIAAIAILAIAYWGIMYILSGVPGIKGVSKDRIWNSLLGLLLALSAYLILEIINPDILASLKTFVNN